MEMEVVLGGDSHNSRRSFAIPLEIITGFPFHLRLPVVVMNRIVMVVGGAMRNIETTNSLVWEQDISFIDCFNNQYVYMVSFSVSVFHFPIVSVQWNIFLRSGAFKILKTFLKY